MGVSPRDYTASGEFEDHVPTSNTGSLHIQCYSSRRRPEGVRRHPGSPGTDRARRTGVSKRCVPGVRKKVKWVTGPVPENYQKPGTLVEDFQEFR